MNKRFYQSPVLETIIITNEEIIAFSNGTLTDDSFTSPEVEPLSNYTSTWKDNSFAE